MSVFKRLCLLIFGLAGIFTLGALVLPWLGPWTEQATSMLTVRWYYIALEVCICIMALGVLIALLRALFTPRRVKAVIVSKSGADQITVTTSAISSQAAYIVESYGDFSADKVWVSARKRAVDVTVRVRPEYAVNITEEGAALHERLVDGLSELAGDTIRSIELEFVEADSLDEAPSYSYDSYAASDVHAPASQASLPPSAESAATQQPSSEITVPMGHSTPALGDGAAAPDLPSEEGGPDQPLEVEYEGGGFAPGTGSEGPGADGWHADEPQEPDFSEEV